MIERGRFIVVEGQGFTGKTEQVPRLVAKLRDSGIDVVETQEPGGVEAAIKIREELLERRKNLTITPEEELELFYKGRGYFLKELVIPSVKQGKWVVSSRFSPSTFVYQGREGGVDLGLIKEFEEKIVGENKPDLCILLDVPAEVIMNRLMVEGRPRHGYNDLDEDRITKRREAYLDLVKENTQHWVVINGNQSIERVADDIWNVVSKHTQQKAGEKNG